MGCHVWFLRPVTQEEFESARLKTYNSIEDTFKRWVDKGLEDEISASAIVAEIKKSAKNNSPCIYGDMYWYELGYGFDFYVTIINGKVYTQVEGFHDYGRVVFTYPQKKIYSYKQFKKYTRSKWYKIPDFEKEKIKEFFHLYKGGVIEFG